MLLTNVVGCLMGFGVGLSVIQLLNIPLIGQLIPLLSLQNTQHLDGTVGYLIFKPGTLGTARKFLEVAGHLTWEVPTFTPKI